MLRLKLPPQRPWPQSGLFNFGWSYDRLIDFVNEPLDKKDWQARVKLADLWQAPELPSDTYYTWEELVSELQKPQWKLPMIRGEVPDYGAAQELRRFLRKRLEDILNSKPRKPNAEKSRDARVYASGALAFYDAAEGLEFLTDVLECEVNRGAYQYRGRRGRGSMVPALHVSLCGCGCGKFFLWEGNGTRKQRKYLDDKHRMNFHNARNVEKKKQYARQRRSEGNSKYF